VKIGLVPQELSTDAFESVWATVSFSRGLFGHPPKPAYIEQVLRELSLWDKRKSMIMTLSGGMKRRVMIAKALAHEPQILFLDEPTAGVDVELRRDMWALVRRLRDNGVTIILTTHYIDEAEEMADRIGVINKGELIVVEEKAELMRKLGKKQLILHLHDRLDAVPSALARHRLTLAADGTPPHMALPVRSSAIRLLTVFAARNPVVDTATPTKTAAYARRLWPRERGCGSAASDTEGTDHTLKVQGTPFRRGRRRRQPPDRPSTAPRRAPGSRPVRSLPHARPTRAGSRRP